MAGAGNELNRYNQRRGVRSPGRWAGAFSAWPELQDTYTGKLLMARLVIFASALLLCEFAFCANVAADEKDDQRIQKLILALQSKDAFERREAAKQLGEETAHIDMVLPQLKKR
jgi:hypothetical protein